MKNIILKNGFLALDKNFGKFTNPEIINVNKIISFSSFPKSEHRDNDVISFTLK